VFMFTVFMTGKKSTVPSGTAQVRVADPPPNMPARNHTEPRCPTMQFPPVVSSCGLMDVGMDNAHCHHSAVNSSRFGESANAIFSGIISPKPIPTIVIKRLVLLFMGSSREEDLDVR